MSSELIILLTGAAVSLSAVILGTYLTISRQSLLGDAISHSLLPGLVLAHLMTGELEPTALFLGALFSGLLASYLIEFIGKRFSVREDIAMGITFTTAFSLGVILLVKYANKSHIDTDCLLFGNLLFIPLEETAAKSGFLSHIPQTLFQSVLMSLLSLFFVYLLHRPFMNLLFHENSFKLSNLPGKLLRACFLTLVSLSIVFGFRAMGSLLIFGLLVLPANFGRLFSKSFLGICVIGYAVSTLSLIIAVKSSFDFDLNPSATWVALLFVLYIFFFAGKVLRYRRSRSSPKVA